MYSLFKKEIASFFGSLTGYIAIIVFLLACGLFLWVFPGNYNIPENNYATLSGLFSLAPWLYLFLVPAVTMRLFAEEKRQGTIETLLARPLHLYKIVIVKYVAALTFVVFSLAPTLLYFLSVYLLGDPVGNIDTGGTWGSFIGLFFLAAIYVAIGLFSSAITHSQVVSFVVAIALSFVFFLGFSLVGSSGIPYFLEAVFNWLSINEHYMSVSRGLIDLRDICYFAGMAILFLQFTVFAIRPSCKPTFKSILRDLRFPLLIFALMLLSLNFLFRMDMTADKRYSLAGVSKRILNELENDVEIEFFLAGEMQPGLRRLQQAVIEKTVNMNTWSPGRFRMKITDPYAITNREGREALFGELVEKGVKPTDFRMNTEQGISTKLIFPGAVINYGDKETAVNFLVNTQASGEVDLNRSIENIEYRFMNAFRKLMAGKKPVIAFLEGHGELNRYDVGDISNSLADGYEIAWITQDNLLQDSGDIRILIIAGPVIPLPEADKFAIDQYIMQGGRVMWLVDPVRVSLDSLQNGYMTVAMPLDLNLNDQLFLYGVRLNYDLVQDVNCSMLRINTALPGNPPRFTPQPWYYSPLLTPAEGHEISRNLNFVMAEFVSSIDTVSSGNIKKTIILSSSLNSRKVQAPAGVSLEMINVPPDRRLFNESSIPTGVLLEGRFQSIFKNRIIDEVNDPGREFIEESEPTKMIILSDASIIANAVDYRQGQPVIQSLGEDPVSGYVFANKDFILNAIQYLNDSEGVMQLRNRIIRLRLLDRARLRDELPIWQGINVIAPVLIVSVFGVSFNLARKRRFRR